MARTSIEKGSLPVFDWYWQYLTKTKVNVDFAVVSDIILRN